MRQITIEALKADGRCYRHWVGMLSHIEQCGCVIDTSPGTAIYSGDEVGWVQNSAIRYYFPSTLPINLLEVSSADGLPIEIYLNVASPMQLDSNLLQYTDYELDVVRDLEKAHEPRVVDHDEFEEARLIYGYSDELVKRCTAVSQAAITLVENWVFADDPAAALQRMEHFMSASKDNVDGA